MIKKIFPLVFLFLLLLPFLATANNGGLLPCGPGTGKEKCELCDIFVLITNILDFIMLYVVPSIAALMFVVGGVWFYFSGVSPEQKRRAQEVVKSVVIGVVIILSAWIVVNTILERSGIIEMNGWKWYDIECAS